MIKKIFINKYLKNQFQKSLMKKKLTYEKNYDYLTYYFKNDAAKKRYDEFNNGIEFFLKNIIL